MEYLRLKGMKVNMDKTEIMWLGKSDPPTSNLTINGHDFCFQNNIKALSITVNRNLSWEDHLVNVIQKGKKLMKGFRFIRKHLTEKQFLQTVTNTFFASTFYCASVWYSSCKITAVYIRLLRTACRDYKRKIPKSNLIKRCKRATPCEWVKYL